MALKVPSAVVIAVSLLSSCGKAADTVEQSAMTPPSGVSICQDPEGDEFFGRPGSDGTLIPYSDPGLLDLSMTSVDASNGALTVVAQFSNGARLIEGQADLPGMFAFDVLLGDPDRWYGASVIADGSPVPTQAVVSWYDTTADPVRNPVVDVPVSLINETIQFTIPMTALPNLGQDFSWSASAVFVTADPLPQMTMGDACNEDWNERNFVNAFSSSA